MRRLICLIWLGLGCGSAKPRYGDVEQGPCRRDQDCPSGQRCVSEPMGHMRSETGEIVGDNIHYRCVSPPPDAAPVDGG